MLAPRRTNRDVWVPRRSPTTADLMRASVSDLRSQFSTYSAGRFGAAAPAFLADTIDYDARPPGYRAARGGAF